MSAITTRTPVLPTTSSGAQAGAPHAWPRTVLIGTPETVRQARDQLALIPGSPEPLGCILTDSRRPRAAGGLPVFGTIDDLPTAASRQHLSLAIVCLPMAMSDTINQVRALLRRLGIAERFIPPLQDLLSHEPPFAVGMAMQAVAPAAAGSSRLDIASLIGRSPRTLDRESVARTLTGKRVLITGAGGSIGSELARIVADFAPSELQLLERAENPLFEIDRVVARRWPDLTRRAILHDVVDSEQTLRLLVDLQPDVVFHAAAHKHVPLMEDHPSHAVNNNLFGTKSIADAAMAVGAERFVMVSTDKAVNPTSVMGATKRLAEVYVQGLHESSRRMMGPLAGPDGSGATSFSIVRFGNVLGSACSVLTIWSAQLADGGPITVTDPRMTRFFMTINEAATLVIQAAAIDHGNSAAVHVLDMGEPISILELAQRFVRAHGFAPRILGEATTVAPAPEHASLPTVDIACTGTRPGEKLHEELAYAAEALRPTPFDGIRAWAGPEGSIGNCAAMIADLSAVRSSRDRAAVLAAIRRHVPEMNAGA